jgi:hypothetical protein
MCPITHCRRCAPKFFPYKYPAAATDTHQEAFSPINYMQASRLITWKEKEKGN